MRKMMTSTALSTARCVLCLGSWNQPHPEPVAKSRHLVDQDKVKFDGLVMPMRLDDLDRFEEMNDNKYSVNVFGLRDAEGDEAAMRSKFVYPLRVTKLDKAEVHVNLLYLEDGQGNAHYVLVKDFDKLMFGQYNKHREKKHFCHNCLHCFKKGETLETHKANGCYSVAGTRYDMPKPGTTSKFCHKYNKMRAPFVMYLDFEAAPMPVHQCLSEVQKSVKVANHEVVSFCLHVVSSVPGVSFEPVLYRGYNAVQVLFDHMKMLELEFKRLFKLKKKMVMTEQDEENFRTATHCRFCDEELKEDRVRDHCHMTGKYRGAAHNDCNFHYHHRTWEVPVFCHNLKGYDSHFLVSQAHKYNARKLDVVAQNSEKFLIFSFDNFGG